MNSPYVIRAVEMTDLALLGRWRAEPHVVRWWGAPDAEPPEALLQDVRVACWIVEQGERPSAFIQDYAVHDWLPHHLDYLPRGARGMDVYIGEAAWLGAGHGARLVRQHVDAMFAQGVPAVGIDPHPDNAIAQAAFQKAGFEFRAGPVETRWNLAVLMDRRAGSAARS